jgi:hypothetical protein
MDAQPKKRIALEDGASAEEEMLVEVFQRIDLDGSGLLDRDELTLAMAQMGRSEAETSALLERVEVRPRHNPATPPCCRPIQEDHVQRAIENDPGSASFACVVARHEAVGFVVSGPDARLPSVQGAHHSEEHVGLPESHKEVAAVFAWESVEGATLQATEAWIASG